ncbi:hypothetical protein [Burkholderia sp. BCC1977]|uniref:hypothetical protein n=1 Tax=Burkholderia sp. BCC1977 TaxID=2817440 RepID=UPI002ABD2FFE|nr:hypothetical protein [Burkholderia sp. BCC1977]
MTRLTPRGRKPLTKSLLLPLPAQEAQRLALKHHLALAMLGQGCGNLEQFATLLNVVYIAFFLRDAKAGSIDPTLYKRAEAALNQCVLRAEQGQPWILADKERDIIEQLLILHVAQLSIVPAHRYLNAWERMQSATVGSGPSPIPAIACPRHRPKSMRATNNAMVAALCRRAGGGIRERSLQLS